MSFRLYARLLVCALVVSMSGCQSGKMNFPWLSSFKGNNDADYSVANRGDLKPAVADSGFDAADQQTEGNSEQVVAAAGRIDQLIKDGQAAVQNASQTDPPDEARLNEAKSLLKEAITLDPGNFQAHHTLAIIADLQQDWTTAETHYKQALDGNREDASLLNDLGYSYLLQNRFHEASQFLNQSIAVNPDQENARFNLALLTLKQGDRDGALNQLSQLAGPSEAQQLISRMESELRNTGNTIENIDLPSLPEIPRDASFEEAMQIAQEVGRRERQERNQRTNHNVAGGGQRIQQWPHSRPQSMMQDQPAATSPQQYLTNSNPLSAAASGQNLVLPPGHTGTPVSPPQQGVPNTGRQPSLTAGQYYSATGNPAPSQNLPATTNPEMTQMSGNPSATSQFNAHSNMNSAPAATAQINGQGITNQTGQSPMSSAAMLPGNVPSTGRPIGGVLSFRNNQGGTSQTPANSGGTPQNSNQPSTAGSQTIQQTGFYQEQPQTFGNGTSPVGLIQRIAPQAQQFPTTNHQTSARGYNQAQVAGLNVGPDSLFPIPAAANQHRVQDVNQRQPANNLHAGSQYQGTSQQQNVQTAAAITSPGTNSVINGAMFDQSRSYLPAQQALPGQSQPSGVPQQLPAGWPSGQQPSLPQLGQNTGVSLQPLSQYEQQLRGQNNQLNNTIQEINAASRNLRSSVRPVQAQY